MKIVEKDKHGMMKIKIDDSEDALVLSSVIEIDDKISEMTERKIKLGGEGEKSKISIRRIFLKIKADKIDLEGSRLRVSGPIVEAPDDIPKGDFHTFGIEQGEIITIEKEKWSSYSIKKIDDAVNSEKINVLLVAFDREEAIFAKLKSSGYEILLDLTGDVSKKDQEEKKGNFYSEIYKQMKSYDERYGFTTIIIASPAFWKEYLMKEIDDIMKKKIVLATCSSIDGSTMGEILKRPELKTVLEKDRSVRELKLIEELLEAIRKDNGAYGVDQVSEKLDAGNVSILMISENAIRKYREEKRYKILEELMDAADALNAEIRLISSEEGTKRLDGLGGVAALLRWKENYG
jgi:protein pelota